jgi:nitroreductase
LRRLSREGVHLSLSRRRLGRLLFLTSMLAITSMLVISRFTSWLMPRAFWCQSYAGSWRVCLHEIYHPPSKNLRMIVMGVSVHRPDRSHLYASMQFFTALPRDGIGFVDVPGSWHFQDRYYFNSQGWLVDHRPQTLSSIVDPLMPSRVQVALWNDIAFEVQERFKARRLTIQSKLIEVSDSYLFMLLAVILATWTALNYMELWILNHEFKSTGSLKPRSE